MSNLKEDKQLTTDSKTESKAKTKKTTTKKKASQTNAKGKATAAKKPTTTEKQKVEAKNPKAKDTQTNNERESKVEKDLKVSKKTKETHKNEKDFDALFTKSSGAQAGSPKATGDSKVVIDNLQKLREQIYAQKKLERELMEKEAQKVQALDQEISSRIQNYQEDLFAASDYDGDDLEKELESQIAKAEHFEQESKRLSKQLKEIEENYHKVINLKFNNLAVIDKEDLELSEAFLQTVQEGIDHKIFEEFSKMEDELAEIREIYRLKQQNDQILSNRIEEFQSSYYQKQIEVEDLKKQISALQSSMPELSEGFRHLDDLDEIKNLYAIQQEEIHKLSGQINLYEQQIEDLHAILTTLDNLDLESIERELLAKDELVQRLENEISALKESLTEVERLNKELEEKDKIITKQKAEIDAQAKNSKTLEAKAKKQEAEVKKLTKDLADSKKSITALEKKTKEYDSLIKEIKALEDTNNELKKSNEQLSKSADKYIDLEKEIELKEQDIIALQEQIKSLDDANVPELTKTLKEKEELILTLQEEINELEKQSDQYQKLYDDYSDLQLEIEANQVELSNLYEELEQYETLLKENQEFQNQLKTHQKEIDKLTKELEQAQKGLEEKEQHILFLEESINSLDKEEDVLRLEEKIKVKDQEIKELQEQQADLQKSLSNYEKVQQELKENQEHILSLNEELTKLETIKKENDEYQKQIALHEEQIVQLTKEISLVKEENEALDGKAKKFDELESDYQQLINEITGRQKEIEDLNHLVNQLKEQVESANESKEQTLAKVKQLQEEKDQLSDTILKLETSKEELSQELNLLKNSYSELSQSQIETAEELKNLQFASSELEEKYHSIDNLLREKNAEYNDLVVLHNDVSQDLENKNALLRQLIDFDLKNLKEELDLKTQEIKLLNQKVKYLSDEVAVRDQTILNLKTNQNQYGDLENVVLAKDTEINALKEQLAEKQQLIEEYQSSVNDLEGTQIDHLQNELEAKEQEITYLNKEIAKLENEIINKRQTIDAIKSENDEQLQGLLSAKELELKAANEHIVLIENKLSDKEDEVFQLQEDLRLAATNLENLENSISNFNLESSTLEEKISKLEQEKSILEEGLNSRRLEYDSLQDHIFRLEEDLNKTALLLNDKNNEVKNLEKLVESKEEKISLLEEKIDIHLQNIEKIENEDIKHMQKELEEKQEAISVQDKELIRLKEKIDNLENELVNVSEIYKDDLSQLQGEINRLTVEHSSELKLEKDSHQRLIENYQKQIAEQKEHYKELLDKRDEKIAELESYLDLYIQDLTEQSVLIDNLQLKLQEKSNVEDDKLNKLEHQINEILEQLSNANIKDEIRETTEQQVYSPYYSDSQNYKFPNNDMQLEALKTEFQKELELRDKLIELIKDDKARTTEPQKVNQEYLEEIESLKAKVNTLMAALEAKEAEEVAELSEQIAVEDDNSFGDDNLFEDIDLELEYFPENQAEIDALDQEIELKQSDVNDLIVAARHNPFDGLNLQEDLNSRALTIVSMRDIIEQRVFAEATKYEESLVLLKERVLNNIETIRLINNRLYQLEKNYYGNKSSMTLDQYENEKSKIFVELQSREESLRILLEEDSVRIKTKYLSFLREKEAHLLKLESEAESILEIYASRSQRKEEMEKQIAEIEQIEDEEIMAEAETSEKIDFLENELTELRKDHQKLYDNLLELRKEMEKRSHAEEQLRLHNPLIIDYLKMEQTIKSLEEDRSRNSDNISDLSRQLESVGRNEQMKSEVLKLKAMLTDAEIIHDDYLNKLDYAKRHREQLMNNPDVKDYLNLLHNMSKMNGIIKQYITRLQETKDAINQKTIELREIRQYEKDLLA